MFYYRFERLINLKFQNNERIFTYMSLCIVNRFFVLLCCIMMWFVLPKYLSAAPSWCKRPVPPHPLGALFDWDPGGCEGQFECIELIDMFKKPVWGDMSFVTWLIILLEVAISSLVHCSHKGMDISVSPTVILGGCPPPLEGQV